MPRYFIQDLVISSVFLAKTKPQVSSQGFHTVNGMSPNFKTQSLQGITFLRFPNEESLCHAADDPRRDRKTDGCVRPRICENSRPDLPATLPNVSLQIELNDATAKSNRCSQRRAVSSAPPLTFGLPYNLTRVFVFSHKPTKADCRRCASGVHSANSMWAITSGLTHLQFFISSFVKAHCVRFRSGRLAKGQVAISNPLSLAATAPRVCGTKPFRTLPAYNNVPS